MTTLQIIHSQLEELAYKITDNFCYSCYKVVNADFCPTCGSPIYSTTARLPDGIVLMAGALDDPVAVIPTMLVYSETAIPWDRAAVAAG